MEQRLAIIILAVALAVVIIAVAGFFLGIQILFWFSDHPLISLSILGAIIIIVAWKTGNSKVALVGVHLILIGILFDFYFPPLTQCAFALPHQELAILYQAPISAFAEDTAVCKLYVDLFPNYVLYQGTFTSNMPLSYFVMPIVFMVVIISLVISVFISPKFWSPTIFLFLYSLILVYLFGPTSVGSIVITTATIWTFVFFPTLLLIGIALANPLATK